jgi:hypothetical protein
MKNIFIYYLAILLPWIPLEWFLKNGESTQFVVFLFLYIFVYRLFTDAYRLLAKGAIEKKDMWKVIVPFSRAKYFKALYFS